MFLTIFGVPKMALRVPESKFWDHFSIQIPPLKPPFRHFGNHFGPRKSDFWPFYLFWSFSHWNSHWSQKNLSPWEGVELQRKQNMFWDQWSSGNNLGTCTKGVSEIFENKNPPTAQTDPYELRSFSTSTIHEGLRQSRSYLCEQLLADGQQLGNRYFFLIEGFP